ncbi:MAG: LytR C-terminal domain-containing protein [Patescibacteria group bacterium]
MKRRPARKVITRPTRKIIARVGIVLLTFLISATFLGIYSLYKYVNQTFASALSDTDSLLEDSVPTVSYIVVEDFKSDPVVIRKVNYIIFDKNTKKVIIYDLPTNHDFEIPGKFGKENLSKMFALGGLNSEVPLESGAKTLSRNIFKLFGFKSDKYVLVSSEHEDSFDNLWRRGGFLNLLKVGRLTNLEGALLTNMNLKEVYNLLNFVDSLPRDRVVEDKAPLCFCDTQNFDDLIRDSTLESDISLEKKNIAILNGTNYSGLASFGARVARNIGGRVVAIDNTERFYDNSYIVADDINSKTVEMLSNVLRIDNIIQKEQSHSLTENEIDRSDVVVIFGFDTSGDLY